MSTRIANPAVIGALVLATLAAFASAAGGSDGLLGGWSGDWSFHRKSKIDGAIDAGNTGDFTEEITLGFDSDHDAAIDQVPGKWKRDGDRFRVDCTPAATATVISDSGDPKATHVLKGKKVRVHGTENLTGRVTSVAKFRLAGERHKNTIRGTFACALQH